MNYLKSCNMASLNIGDNLQDATIFFYKTSSQIHDVRGFLGTEKAPGTIILKDIETGNLGRFYSYYDNYADDAVFRYKPPSAPEIDIYDTFHGWHMDKLDLDNNGVPLVVVGGNFFDASNTFSEKWLNSTYAAKTSWMRVDFVYNVLSKFNIEEFFNNFTLYILILISIEEAEQDAKNGNIDVIITTIASLIVIIASAGIGVAAKYAVNASEEIKLATQSLQSLGTSLRADQEAFALEMESIRAADARAVATASGESFSRMLRVTDVSVVGAVRPVVMPIVESADEVMSEAVADQEIDATIISDTVADQVNEFGSEVNPETATGNRTIAEVDNMGNGLQPTPPSERGAWETITRGPLIRSLYGMYTKANPGEYYIVVQVIKNQAGAIVDVGSFFEKVVNGTVIEMLANEPWGWTVSRELSDAINEMLYNYGATIL